MNDTKQQSNKNKEVIILIGSNIDPINNIIKVLSLLSSSLQINRISRTWETAAVGSNDSNFLNLAICVLTTLNEKSIKENVLLSAEAKLGRVRTSDKNAARTMDLDIIIYDHAVKDQDLWNKAFIALPVADLLPDLPHPAEGIKLHELAKRLQLDTYAVVRDDIVFNI